MFGDVNGVVDLSISIQVASEEDGHGEWNGRKSAMKLGRSLGRREGTMTCSQKHDIAAGEILTVSTNLGNINKQQNQ